MMAPGLAALIAPHSTEHFFDNAWPHQPFVVHDLDKSVANLRGLPFLESLSALFAAWPFDVQAHLPDVADEASSVDVKPADAHKLFNNKMSLLFNRADRVSPVLRQWLGALRADLGLPAMTDARCIIYATPDGKGTAPHFDQNINFVLQVHGTKKWRLAPNEHVENPTQRHTMGLPLDPELAPYAVQPLPTSWPAEDQEFVLKPGSMLFVPRGYWHRTSAQGEALALNFTFSQPTWVDLFSAALRSRLSLSPDWRELADGVSSRDPDRREVARQKLDFLIEDLVADLPQWQAEDILGATEGDPENEP